MLTDMPEDDSRHVHGAMLLTALGNRNRLVILRMLTKGEMTIGSLSLLTGISKSTLSQHLAKLRDGQLVVRRRSGQAVYYSCPSDSVRQILRTLEEIWPNSQIRRKSLRSVPKTVGSTGRAK